jgi:hypothetical protein
LIWPITNIQCGIEMQTFRAFLQDGDTVGALPEYSAIFVRKINTESGLKITL